MSFKTSKIKMWLNKIKRACGADYQLAEYGYHRDGRKISNKPKRKLEAMYFCDKEPTAKKMKDIFKSLEKLNKAGVEVIFLTPVKKYRRIPKK